MDEADVPELGDFRRAAVLISHHASVTPAQSAERVRAIVVEAVGGKRLSQLLRALDGGYRVWLGELRSVRAQEWLRELIDDVAHTYTDPFTRLAARAIRAMRDEDYAEFETVLEEADTISDGGPRLVGAMTDLYGFLLPELATPSGRRALVEWTADIARCGDGMD